MGTVEITLGAVVTLIVPSAARLLTRNRPVEASRERSTNSLPMEILPPWDLIFCPAVSHIMPGPRRGYSKLSISDLTFVGFLLDFHPIPAAMEFRMLFATASHRFKPLMRWAAQSAEISSQDMPQTFSV
jgi:hypothetical protein